ETLAVGRPAISTDVGDIKEVLDEYGCGVVVPEIGDTAAYWESFLRWRNVLGVFRESAELSAEKILSRYSTRTTAQQYDNLWSASIDEYRNYRRARMAPRIARSSRSPKNSVTQPKAIG